MVLIGRKTREKNARGVWSKDSEEIGERSSIAESLEEYEKDRRPRRSFDATPENGENDCARLSRSRRIDDRRRSNGGAPLLDRDLSQPTAKVPRKIFIGDIGQRREPSTVYRQRAASLIDTPRSDPYGQRRSPIANDRMILSPARSSLGGVRRGRNARNFLLDILFRRFLHKFGLP